VIHSAQRFPGRRIVLRVLARVRRRGREAWRARVAPWFQWRGLADLGRFINPAARSWTGGGDARRDAAAHADPSDPNAARDRATAIRPSTGGGR
jgi:hypothetical protein